MLRTRPIRHFRNDLDKRWTSDDFFDLVVWYEASGGVHGFQLSYDKPGFERALTWTKLGGFHHCRVDSGDFGFGHMSPVLVPAGDFPLDDVRREFAQRGQDLDPRIFELVMDRIIEFGHGGQGASQVTVA